MKLGAVRIVLWSLVALALAALAFALTRPASTPPAGQTSAVGNVGGPFTLTGSDGKAFSSSQLDGKPRAIFFGLTHCPDVCPTTLARLAKLRRQAGGDAAFEIVFISVDPQRDTPAEMARYAGLFDTPIVALTGSVADVETVKKAFGIFSEKVPTGGDDYTVDHSAAVLLFDRAGDFIGTIAPDEGDAAALAKLKRIAA
jgi:protein SCO1/2